MDNSILVSVIIPAYNAEKYIKETVNSVVKQTHSNLEVIVVDDGSTDNTVNFVAELSKSDSRIQLIKQENQGVSVARNTGFSNSHGEYIAFLDADDVWGTNHVELVLQKFHSDETLGLVHADAQQINDFSQKNNNFYCGAEGYLLDNLLLGGMNWIIGTSGLAKRKVVESVGGFDKDLSNCADQEFFFRVTSKYKVGRVPMVTWYYRIHKDNMHSNINLLEVDTLTAYKKADKHKLFKSLSFRKKCYSNMYFMLAGSFWTKGNNKIKAVKYLTKSAFIYFPTTLIILKKRILNL